MCYYNAQKVTHAEFLRLKQIEKTIVERDFFNRLVIVGFDFGPTTVLKPIEGKDDFEIVQMEWGFIPDPLKWPFIETRQDAFKIRRGYTDARGKFIQPLNFLNAVSEELLQSNKVYRQAALQRRCIIPSSGFYDWRHIFPLNKRTGQPLKTAVKYPYRVMVKDKEIFWIAGVWNQWTDAETGETIDTCAVVTTEANLAMSQIHNSKKRMPTMLNDDLAWEWMFGKLDEKRISEIARWQIPWQDLDFYTLAKDFLNSHDPLKEFVYPELPALDIPGLENQQPQGQMELF
ncbi:MAG TPA: SOS response-associated peptidase family protein [Chitinophagaceae bacterium]|nr:SOS response-associated peptidase family protein [Chitinophagaceae bacterium]